MYDLYYMAVLYYLRNIYSIFVVPLKRITECLVF